MRNCNEKLLAAMAAFLVCTAAAALEWPLPDGSVTQNFGLNDEGRPVLGIVFAGEGDIAASGNGMILFSRGAKDSASRLPSPFGAWTALDHGDGLVSIYSRYRDEALSPRVPYFETGERIASAGISGWSSREGFYFVLYDRKERRWVNASMVIPPFPDTVPPQISGIQLRNSNGRIFEGSQLRSLSQGSYTIIINTFDTLIDPRGEQLAPHHIVCSVNGEEAGSLSFETINAKSGILMVNQNGPTPARKAYAPCPSFEAAEVYLSRGQVMLEILVHDIAGNSRSSISRITIE